MTFLKNTEIFDYLKNCTDEQLQDVNFLEEFMKTKIGVNLNIKKLGIPEEYKNYMGGLKAKQYPNEFAQYLAWLYKLCTRKSITNYLCIGPERGGEFFTIDSFFRRLNSNFTKSLAIDIQNQVVGVKAYQEIFDIEFRQADSRKLTWNDIPFDRVDYCFIDGDHSYEGVKSDFEMVKDHCRYVAFHDIHCTVGRIQVEKFWNEIKNDYKHWEFANVDPLLKHPVGIGVIKV